MEKRSQLFFRAIFILPRYPEELPPPLTAIFISGAGVRALSPMDGWKGALTHQNFSIRTSLLLTTSKAASYPFSDAILGPVWEISVVNGEGKPQITDGETEAGLGRGSCFNSLYRVELGFEPRPGQIPPF